jgi:hypothetical protein
MILWPVGWYTPLRWRVIVPMIGFISSWVTHAHLITLKYSSTALSLIYTIYSTSLHTHKDSQSPLVVPQQRLSTQKLTQSHTSNVTHKVFNSHDPLFSNYKPSSVVSHLELSDIYSRSSFSLSYKPLIWHAGKRSNCCATADEVTWPFPTLASSKCLYLLPGNKRGEAMRDSLRLGSARRKHRFVYCCVIAAACFNVTVLAWRKYATIYTMPQCFVKWTIF